MRATRSAANVLVLATFLLAGVTGAVAQVSGGSITGTVTDPTGAVIPGVTVTITNRSTGISQVLKTTASGLFNEPNLDPGTYDVTFVEAGFANAKAEALVDVSHDTVLQVQMQVGTEDKTVYVTSATPVVDLGSTQLNQTVDGKTLRELPLNGRDWTSLSVLEPNVHTVDNQLNISSGDNTRSNRGVGTQISIGGTRPQQNNYRLDGITTNDYSGSGPGGALGGTLGVDAIQEFSVVTSNATADYGRTSGGVISGVTRQGTNKFHGSAYEFIRNSALDAKNYFSTGSAPFKRNQFGGAIGGPVLKDKAFFFFNYEGLRQSRTTATIDTVPSAAARTGALVSGHVTVSPAVIPYLALFPLPNAGTSGDVGTWTFDSKAVASENLFTGRADYTLSPRDAIHGTALSDDSTDTQPDGFNFVLTGLNINRKVYSIQESHQLLPNIVNFARVGYAYTFSIAPASSIAINPLASDTALGFVPGQNVGELQISGLSTFFGGVGAEGTYSWHYNSYQAADDVYITKGSHSLQVGFSFEQIQSNDRGNVTNGFFTFGSLSNFLTNKPTQFTSNIPGSGIPIYLRQKVYGAYAFDSYHFRKNLTLIYGVRYEPTSSVTEKYGHIATLTNPASPTLKLGGALFQNPTLTNLAPRVGVAWDPFGAGKTSVRASYGIYDNLPLTYQFTLSTLTVAPYGSTANLTDTTVLAGTFPAKTYPLAIAAATNKVTYIQQNPGRPYVQQFIVNIQQELARNISLEMGWTGSHGVRQTLKANDGNIVEPLQTSDLHNLIWPKFACTTVKGVQTCKTTGVKQNPKVGGVDTTLFNESTSYHALNVALRGSARNARLGIAYTWAKSIDESSSSNGGTNFTNSIISPFPTVIGRFKGLSDFNIGQNIVINGLYTFEGPKASQAFIRALTSGYQLGGIVRVASGLPFTPLISGDPLGLSNNNPLSLPDRLMGPGCTGNPVNLRDKANYLKRSCFAFPANIPATGGYFPRLGNAGRNSVFGPGIATLDASIVKNTSFARLSETARVEFRAEAFNLLNHPNFSVPSRTASALFNAAGTPLNSPLLTTTSTTERQIQFGLKIIF
ncbi:TonB-dependent receptor [Edaphobacter bradus]|uniref:TonB-dependent receptor n=1 Tax=Edaphobacter bradus TaxID=2259016 RepID=UPI0021DFA93B|nr:TonB-dependent receptor [Edaphobacter bradus]